MNRRKIFGSKVQNIRVMRGLTIDDVAKGTGFKPSTIRNIEAGSFSADFDILDKIAQFYKMEISLI